MKSILILLITITAVLPALAEGESRAYPQPGIEFGLPSYLGLDRFGPEELDGFDASWTRRTSATRGWRFGTTLSFFDDDDHDIDERGYEEYVQIQDYERDRSSLNIAIQTQKLFLGEPRNGMAYILGIGPGVGYSQTKSKDTRTNRYIPDNPGGDVPEDRLNFRETDSHSFWAGLVWDIGFEWRISRQVSLGARYQWALKYEIQESDTTESYEGGNSGSERGHEEGDSLSLRNGNSVDLVATFWY